MLKYLPKQKVVAATYGNGHGFATSRGFSTDLYLILRMSADLPMMSNAFARPSP